MSKKARRLYIPDIGHVLTLAADWNFTLHNEHRNNDVVEALGVRDEPKFIKASVALELLRNSARYSSPETFTRYYAASDKLRDWTWPATLPAGTVLRVDRIYIRQGAADFSSLSFYVEKSPLAALTPAKKGGGFKKGRRRFWAKLADVNTMMIEEATNA